MATQATPLNPRLREYMAQGYAKVGSIGFKICENLVKGKDHVRSQQELWNRGVVMVRLLKVLYRHVYFDPTTQKPTLYRIEPIEVNQILAKLIELGELDLYPVVPTILPSSKPLTIVAGQQGAQGIPGINGTNANIVVQADIGETQIEVREDVVGPIKNYYLKFVAYVEQLLSSSVIGGNIFEVGDVRSFNINILSTKGKNSLQTLACISSGTIDAILQPLVNLPALNGVSQPVTIVLPLTNQSADTTYIFESYDGKTHKQATCSIGFYYPYLTGISDNTTGFDHYSTLSKTIRPKENRSFLLNGTNKYFWIGYPASYGNLTSIKDANGYEKIADFTPVSVNVSSSGLTNNWINVPYKFYRTTLKTSIANANYTISF